MEVTPTLTSENPTYVQNSKQVSNKVIVLVTKTR